MIGVDEITQLAGGELEQRRVALMAVKGFEHALPRVLIDAVHYIVGKAIGSV